VILVWAFIQPIIDFLVSDEITRGDFFFSKNALLGLIQKGFSILIFSSPFKVLLSRKQIEFCEINAKKKEVDGQTLLY